MKTSNKINLFLIILPGALYLLAVILIYYIIISNKADMNFKYTNGKISGSRWFSYKYSGNNYFQENDSLLHNQYIFKNDAIKQVPRISKSREYSIEEINLLYNIIDSFSQASKRNMNNIEEIDIMKLNIALDNVVQK